MTDFKRSSFAERDTEQAITVLKKGAYLLKYGRRGKPQFFPFRLSSDETLLIWYSGKEEKQLKLSHVSRIIPGQRTAIFQHYPQPEKEYQSFSLIYNDRSLDLICKDRDEAEVWFAALRALISQGNYCKSRSDSVQSDSPRSHTRKNSPSNLSCGSSGIIYKDPGDSLTVPFPYENSPQNRLGRALSEVLSFIAAANAYTGAESVSKSLGLLSSGSLDTAQSHSSAVDTFRISLSSAVSSSSQGSFHEDFDALCDVFIWGEGIGDGLLGGGINKVGNFPAARMDALLPKALETTVVVDVHNIACGSEHAVLVTKQGQIFSWGEGSGGRLGHGVEADVSHPKLIDALRGSTIELVACGEFHTCAVTLSGDLYTWGHGIHSLGLLGHASDVSHWTPKKVSGRMEGVHVSSISCGPWHTAAVTSAGELFTFGDETFGALGHGDRSSTSMPREVETLKGLRTLRASCGVWHTAAVVEVNNETSGSSSVSFGKLFTWGDGDKGQLGHGDKEPKLVPSCVSVSDDTSFCQVACGHSFTVALTASGQVYTMGSPDNGHLGSPGSIGKIPTCIEGIIRNSCIEEIACGSHHIAVLSSKAEVYTWGKGANGQLGHGDNDDRNIPTLVKALKGKQVKRVVCGSNFTAAICLHKWVSSADHSICSGCHNPFNFRRKRHNCYNCGSVFCKACSSKKSLKAALAPNMNKPYRVCDDCFTKLKRSTESGLKSRCAKILSGDMSQNRNSAAEKESMNSGSRRRLSRLASLDSVKQAKSRNSKCNRKQEFNSSNVSPLDGSFQWESASMYGSSKNLSISVPGSRMVSKVTSPVSRKSSPAHSLTVASDLSDLANPDVILDDSKQTNDGPTREIFILRAQVEDLASKSQLIETELERTSRQLKEAVVTAKEEAEKHKAAKEVIRSLTAQVKDMSAKVSEQLTAHTSSGSPAEITSNILSPTFSENQLTSPNATESHLMSPCSPEHESNGNNIVPISSTRSKEISGNLEWVLKDEPGVYSTVSSLPRSGKCFQQVQFSQKYFTEEQA